MDFCQNEWVRAHQNWAFSNFQSLFSMPKTNLIFLKTIFLYEYQIRRTNFTKKIFKSNNFKKLCLVKMCAIFGGSSPSQFVKYQKNHLNSSIDT